ncbi:hypothetical protein EDB85DRAFT_2147300 [Lactarius pseudohatsudake]|nr:hypothetical protein EDB85DRAFT_2147300 [Lactarius pseudohatsudake]
MVTQSLKAMLRSLVTHLLHFEFFLRDRQRLSSTVYSTQQPTTGPEPIVLSLLPRRTFAQIGNTDPTHGCLAAPYDLPVYLLLVQSHLRKSCLWACMELGMDEGDGVIGHEEGANATIHHCCITLHRAWSSPSAHSSAWAPIPQIDSVIRAEPSISIRSLHIFTLAVHFAARSSPTEECRPCHVRLLPQV